MITKELLDFIKKEKINNKSSDQIKSELITNSWSAIDIEEAFKNLSENDDPLKVGYQKIKKIFKNEVIFTVIFFIVGLFLFYLGTYLFLGFIGQLGLPGIAIFFLVLTGPFPLFYWMLWGLIVLVVYIINIIRVVKLKKRILASITSEQLSSGQYNIFVAKSKTVYIFNTVIIILIIIISAYSIYSYVENINSNAKKLQVTRAEQQVAKIKNEGNRIEQNLINFKGWIKSIAKDNYLGYGKIENDGNCVNAKLGSLFNPGGNFEPKVVLNGLLDNADVSSSVSSIRQLYVDSSYSGLVFNNMQDARCFSNEDHYAYQVPNYFEDPYPTFYCVDDIRPDVQVSNKQIKGPDCTDFDPNYVPPTVRPEPDKKGYTADSSSSIVY